MVDHEDMAASSEREQPQVEFERFRIRAHDRREG
jgi:hypothetical protein